jgi:hypothetical protein
MRYIIEEVKDCNKCPYKQRSYLQFDVVEIHCPKIDPYGGVKSRLFPSDTYPEIPDTCPLPKEPTK